MSRVLDLLDRQKGAFQRQADWLPLWQELSDVFYPTRGGFTTSLTAGQQPRAQIYDGTPQQARRGLATVIDGLMKPSTSRWFWMKALNDNLNDDDDAKRWFDIVGDRMWSAIYNPPAGFSQHSGAVDNDLSTFGIGYLWIGENKARNGLNFRSLFLRDVAVDENADGRIDTVYIKRCYTARQAYQRWGDALTGKIKEALDSTDTKQRDKKFDFVQCVYPREERDTRYRDNKNMAFASEIIAVDDEEIVEETGYQEFPLAVPRWEVSPGEVYGRSPAMIALPDANTLQAMGHTLLVGGQRAVDPPIWTVDDGMMSAVRTFPGGLTVVSAETVQMTNGHPLGHLEMGSQIPIGREMQDDYRKMVEAAFYKNVFNLPAEQHDMTAFEVRERKEEFLRTIGPTLGQLESDYIGSMVTRVFGIMSRAGAFPPPPDVLLQNGGGAQFEFMSPIQQAKRQVEAAGMAQAFQFAAPILQLQPDVAANLDGDEIMRDLPDAFGLPEKYLRTKDQVAQMRQAQQQQMAAQQALLEAAHGAGTVKTLADAGKSAAQAGAAGVPAPSGVSPTPLVQPVQVQ